MDLIYANERREDIGVLTDYTFDLAFGKDENDFECEVSCDNHVCKKGYLLYIEGTEYGGVIDRIIVNTAAENIAYCGRTWHGILAGKILEPDIGEDYLLLSGEANQVLAFLIKRLGLSSVFAVSTKNSGMEIVEYPVRYTDAYTTIRKMLYSATGKLKMQYKKNIVELEAVSYIDYSQNEEWDSSQLDFTVEQNYRPVNHLICLGSGELKNRKVIHLFTDENGGVQPYVIRRNPVQDSDYIQNVSKQVLFGENEVAEIYDYPNAAATENYISLQEKPKNWESTYMNYYRQDEEENYKLLESWQEDVYTLQRKQPYDWENNYKDYFKLEGDAFKSVESLSKTIYTPQARKPPDWDRRYGNYFYKSGSSYKEPEAVVTESYKKQTKKPSDWKKNYGDYYYYYSDGVSSEYRKVSGITKYRYLPQTKKPSDWGERFKSYFIKKKDSSGYSAVEGTGEKKDKAPKWKAKKYYTQESYQVAPKWEKSKYFTHIKKSSPPSWEAGRYYTKSVQEVPMWAANTYYTKTTETFIPEWIPGSYFIKYIDNFAELVIGGLERLKESYNCNSIDIAFEPEQNYDIGDVVGAIENTTGISVWQPITKKIVTIKENKEEIQYEIGE